MVFGSVDLLMLVICVSFASVLVVCSFLICLCILVFVYFDSLLFVCVSCSSWFSLLVFMLWWWGLLSFVLCSGFCCFGWFYVCDVFC